MFEATGADLANRGAGIIAHQILFDALSNLGISIPNNVGVTIRTRKTFAKDSSVVGTTKQDQVATSWGRIYQLLKQQFPQKHYHTNLSLLNFQQLDGSVISNFSDGTSVSSELLVAADGIRSTVRQQLEPGSRPQYVGYIAWRGLINEEDLDESEKREILPYFTFCLPHGEQVLSYPVTGKPDTDSVSHKRLNMVWYRPASSESTLMEMLTDVDGNNNGISIAPDKIRSSIVQRMRQDADNMLSPQHAKLMRRLTRPFIQPIYDLTTQSMVHGNIALVGDAAFTARPHIGIGITKAVEDAVSLAVALEHHTDLPYALSRYNNNRYNINRAWVDRSRALGAYLQSQVRSADERRHAQQHRTTESVMNDTANINY